MPRHKQTAVARNRVKRRLREMVRREFLPAMRAFAAVDVVVRAMPEAYAADAAMLAADLMRAAARMTKAAS